MSIASQRSRLPHRAALIAALAVVVGDSRLEIRARGGPVDASSASLSATEFFPDGFVKDGSVSYQPELQKAIDQASREHRTLVFPPMPYLLDNEAGLSLRSGMTLSMYGAVFRFDSKRTRDGQAFLGTDVSDVTLLGGEVVGARASWADSVNIAGVRITGKSGRIRIRDMAFRSLSSHGVGCFAANAEEPIRDVSVTDTTVRECCNVYADYLQPKPGPAPGSRREDQGGIALYHVVGFVVRGCVLADSRSDGTHFYRCRDGQFTDNRVVGSKMGGYFLEGCQDVMAAGNLIRGNGSRGVTIERNSRNCTFVNNIVKEGGREGLWAPDVAGCLIVDNVFGENGRKLDAGKDSEIRIDEAPEYATVTCDLRIAGNLITTGAGRGAAVWISEGTRGLVVERNLIRGPVRTIRVGVRSGETVLPVVRENDGAVVESPAS